MYGAIFGLEVRPLAALLEVRFAHVPQIQVPTVRHRSEISEIHSSYMESYIWSICPQAPSLALWGGYLCLSDLQFLNPHLWLETIRLPYAGYDHILSK